MSYASWLGIIGTISFASALLCGCNSTTDDGSGSGTSNASATGVWSGSDSVSGLGVTALINAAGQATFIRGDGVQFTGLATLSTGSSAGQLMMAVTGASSSTKYSLVSALSGG